jgi:hypothetical protein
MKWRMVIVEHSTSEFTVSEVIELSLLAAAFVELQTN